MKGLVLRAPEKIEIGDVGCPQAGAGEVLVKVEACGICGSDIPRAYRDGAHNMPLIIGHEFAGEVDSCGEGVDKDWQGKHVGVFPLIPCMKCDCCKIRKYEMCSNYSYLGSRRDGGFAEYVSVPEWNLIELPDCVGFDSAAMMEPMAVAVHAIRQAFRTKGYDIEDVTELIDKKVVVVGLGTIGLLVVMFLKDLGFKNVYTIGNKELQKKMVADLGVDEEDFCDINVWDEIDWIRGNTNAKGADYLFECVGNSRSLDACIYGAAPEAVICTVGNPGGDMDLHRHAYWQILRNQLTLVGTWNSSFTHEDSDDWHYVLERVQQGNIHPEKLITHIFPLEDIVEGFEIMRDKKEAYVKVMAEMMKM